MKPEVVSWIVILCAAGGAGKFIGLVFPGGGLGLVGNPIAGLVGGVVVSQAAVRFGVLPPLAESGGAAGYVVAGIVAFAGGAALVLLLSILRKGKS